MTISDHLSGAERAVSRETRACMGCRTVARSTFAPAVRALGVGVYLVGERAEVREERRRGRRGEGGGVVRVCERM